jgi:hypothetical protein
MAPEREEPLVPRDFVAVAARDRRAQVVIDAFADDAAEPVEDPDVPFQEALAGQVKAEMRRLRPGIGQRRDQRVDPALAPGDSRTGRHLTPVELQHLPRPIGRPLRRPRPPRPQHCQTLADQIDRAGVFVIDTGSTQQYIHADMTIKERALALLTPPTATPGRYTPTDQALAYLDSLG